MEIKDNFISKEDLIKLEKIINHPYFPWYLQKNQTENDGSWFSHLLYIDDRPQSEFFSAVWDDIFGKYFHYVTLCRIHASLLINKNQSIASNFHRDYDDIETNAVTTAIFYLNTNNGYTEFETGEKVSSVKNRLVMFPRTIAHRAVSQTNTDNRFVLNFNFIKGEEYVQI